MRLFVFLFNVLFLFAAAAEPLAAQEVKFSRPFKMNNKVKGYSLLGNTAEGIAVYVYGDHYHQIQMYNRNNLQLEWSRDLPLESKKANVIEILPQWNNFVLFYSLRQDGMEQVFVQQLSLKLNPQGEKNLITEYKSDFIAPRIQWELITDNHQQHIVLLKKITSVGRLDEITFLGIDSSFKKKYEIPFSFDDGWQYHLGLLNNDGTLYLCNLHSRRGFITANDDLYDAFSIHQIDVQGNKKELIADNLTYTLNDLVMEYDTRNDNLLLCGFYTERQQASQSNGYFFTKVSPTRWYLEKPVFKSFDENTIQKTQSGNTTLFGNNNTLNNFITKRVLPRNDGGVLMLAESYYVSARTMYNTFSLFNDFGQRDRQISSYYFNDVVALSLLPNGELEWVSVLKKEQYSESDNGYYGSFGVMNSKQAVHLIFNETISFNSNVNEYLLNTDSNYAVKTLLNSQEFNVLMAVRYARQISNYEIVIPAFNYRGEFLLAKVHY